MNVHPNRKAHGYHPGPSSTSRFTHKQEILRGMLQEPYAHIKDGFKFNTIACSHRAKWDMRDEDRIRLIWLTWQAVPMDNHMHVCLEAMRLAKCNAALTALFVLHHIAGNAADVDELSFKSAAVLCPNDDARVRELLCRHWISAYELIKHLSIIGHFTCWIAHGVFTCRHDYLPHIRWFEVAKR